MKLDMRITIEQKVVTQDPDYGTEIIAWTPLAVVWANVLDELPSRAESVSQGLAVASNRTRIRFRYRNDVTSAMRIRLGSRVMQIIGGPSEIGRREFSEVMCEAYSS